VLGDGGGFLEEDVSDEAVEVVEGAGRRVEIFSSVDFVVDTSAGFAALRVVEDAPVFDAGVVAPVLFSFNHPGFGAE